ncbi:MAG: hypothetical protein M3Q44_02325 [bacterium]|nr:hypothetical protein [bacterium]
MKIQPIILLMIFVVVGYFLFGNTLHYYFVSDDFIWLYNAKNDTYEDLLRYAIDAQGFFYRPFTETYFYFMWRWFGADPYPYHVVNILLHFFNSLVVYFLSLAILNKFYTASSRTKKSFFACVTALLFFVHPVHQENILWISAVTELFPAAFLLSALLIFVKGLSPGKLSSFNTILLFLLFILGLMSHEYAVIFPVLLYLTEYFVTKKLKPLHKGFYLGLIVIDCVYLLVRAQANAHWSGGDYSYNLARLPFNFIGNSIGYIGLNVIGVPFVYLYQNVRNVMRDNLLLSGLLLLILIAGCFYIVRIARRNYLEDVGNSQSERLLLYLALFFFVSLLPFLGLGGIAERYLYLPSFSFLLFLSLFLYWVIRYFDIPAKQYKIWYYSLISLLCILYIYNAKVDQNDWRLASDFVYNRLGEFRDHCSSFSEGEKLSRLSPPNRVGRAWVFQVGYEQGANVLCDKKITILLK